MSINKNAIIRYGTLDKCFRNPGRMYFWEDLLDACNDALVEFNPKGEGVQRRQLFDDIRFMESEQGWSIPLERKRYGRKVYYRYEDLNFSINNQPLNTLEAEQIKSALQIIGRFAGTPQFEWVNEMIPRLESKFDLARQDQSIISFEGNIDLKGIHFLGPLFNAIINKRVLYIDYQDFKSLLPYQVTFHPHFLKQYNNRWFLFGFNAINQTPNWNLALDRIVDIKETNLEYRQSETNWEDYFYDIIGVTKPKGIDIQEIVLRFTPELAPYITTKPLHGSQRTKHDPTGLEVKIKVIPNYELERLILAFGDQVKVVSPIVFKETVAQRIKKMGMLYLEGSEGMDI